MPSLKDLFVKKDTKGKLTTGAKVGIGAAALSIGLIASGVFKKNKNPTITDIVKGTGNVANDTTPQPLPPQYATPPPQKSNTMMYVGIGVGALVLIGVIVYASKK